MKEITTLLPRQVREHFGVLGDVPPPVTTREETALLYRQRKRRHRLGNRLPAKFQAIRDLAERHRRQA